MLSMGKRKNINFKVLVKDKKLPILTLDGRWHELFPEGAKSNHIKELEHKVNNLLKKQGKLVNDIKDMKDLKKSLLNEIVANMDVSPEKQGKLIEKKLVKSKQFVNELNQRIDKAMDELAEIPYMVKEANEELMAESIKICYNKLNQSHHEINDINQWIAKTRNELKEKIILKQEMEQKNTTAYTYMHDVLGPDLMELFDKQQET